MDIAAWLRGLGLEQYAPAFRDNDVDAEVLPSLTADDLISIGVKSVGHRRKLLDASAALRTEPSSPREPGEGRAGAKAERRQLTVMFSDLVGSTPLSAQFDPEDLREIIAAYHRAVADVVRSFEGFVAKYMGDGVLAYFGYPRAHEDDAERAVRAGLGVVDAVARLDVRSVKLRARVGIATGLVVVGDLIGEGSAQEQSVVGETPNIAARLQAMAEPGAVVIAASTRRLVGEIFDCRDLGALDVKGIAGPILVWRVVRPSAIESRFEALRGSALSPLIGRDEEIELLLRRWARAEAGDGQVVLISGEPGIGKSRIIHRHGISSGQLHAWRQQLTRGVGGQLARLGDQAPPAPSFARVVMSRKLPSCDAPPTNCRAYNHTGAQQCERGWLAWNCNPKRCLSMSPTVAHRAPRPSINPSVTVPQHW